MAFQPLPHFPQNFPVFPTYFTTLFTTDPGELCNHRSILEECMELLPEPGPDLPLTFAELRVMSLKYVDNTAIKGLVDEAMMRRVTDVQRKTV